MSRTLKLYELTASPNNVKVRIALGLKGLAYDRVSIRLEDYPGDRTEIIAVSGQPRLPVLVDGDTVLFDSSAILRYLDANFRDTPQLYSSDFAELRAIEDWELWARTDLAKPVMAVLQQTFSGAPDAAVCQAASASMHDATARIEAALEGRDYLFGTAPKAADVVCVPAVNMAMLPASAAHRSPLAAVFVEHFSLGEGRERTRAWVERLMAHDVVGSSPEVH